jgi:hypothetical protein
MVRDEHTHLARAREVRAESNIEIRDRGGVEREEAAT